MQTALSWAADKQLPVFLLGQGSNILVSDEGFDGLVIKDENVDFNIVDGVVTSGSGVNLGYFVDQCVESGLAGAEYLAGIPGTVGGAVRGNAGAWGHDIGELTRKVLVFNGKQAVWLTAAECAFRYRTSKIKEQKFVILTAVLELRKGVISELRAAVNEYLRQRAARHPIEPSAGSVFKNIELRGFDQAAKLAPALGVSPAAFADATKHGKLAVGYIVDRLDLRGKKIGGAQISPKHGNIIINTGHATAKDVIALVSLIKQQVRDKTGLQLEEEIQYVGF